MNAYATLTELKSLLDITATDKDTLLLLLLEAASRQVEGPFCTNRVFWTKTEARYFDGADAELIYIDDLISATEIAEDSAGDYTYATALTENTDYVFWPENHTPRMAIRCLDNNFSAGKRMYRVTGTWGYLETSWLSAGITGTVATTAGTALTLSAAGNIAAGHTLLIESEQIYVTAVSGTTATVERGMNGTTAAAHSAKAISVAQYPEEARRATLWIASESYKMMPNAGTDNVTIGQYTERFREMSNRQLRRIVGSLWRPPL